MNKRMIRRWLPTVLYGTAAVAILVFGFLPANRKARTSSRQARVTEEVLDAKLAVLAQLPKKKSELNSLVHSLTTFRDALHRTHEVDEVMRSMVERAGAAGVEFWYLNPSLPVLVTLEEMPDSLARLNLAILPVRFDCRGDFQSVGRFIEAEEQRPDFCQWQRLALSADLRTHGVQARGEILLFLLPEMRLTEAAS